jgi:hypothetical protein
MRINPVTAVINSASDVSCHIQKTNVIAFSSSIFPDFAMTSMTKSSG